MEGALHGTVDHLFRHEYARIVAALTSRYSPDKIDMIEDAVQEALYKAMKTWPFGETPSNPSGWLFRVANNCMLDQLRRASRQVRLEKEDKPDESAGQADFHLQGELQDEQLKMIFAVCHPALQLSEQMMLSLKLLGGLSTKEIARALFKQPDAVKRAISRAKEKFRQKIGRLEVPRGDGLKKRLSTVLQVLYLMFNEGYKAADGEALIRRDICEEAIRLGLLLRRHDSCNSPELNALLALMCFHASRFDARIDEEGKLLTLENQDRKLWDQVYIQFGHRFFNDAIDGLANSRYHLLAGIAAHYASAKSFEETDWKAILFVYNHLIKVDRSPFAALNRAVVVEKVDGVDAAIAALDEIEGKTLLEKSYLYYAIRADFARTKGEIGEAVALLEHGLKLAGNKTEAAFLQDKLMEHRALLRQ